MLLTHLEEVSSKRREGFISNLKLRIMDSSEDDKFAEATFHDNPDRARLERFNILNP